ncbi:MAG: response regulator [Nitrospirae bacterium]|nr:response regulator [Nitrospirota bacterium]
MNILIVDDHEESRTYMRHLLQSHDCAVVEAVDGRDGIGKALAYCPDMIVSDSLMPNMDGFQMLMEIKRDEKTRDIPFLFYSGNYIGEQDAELALSLGADAYLLKPMQPGQLWHEIQRRFRKTGKEKEGRYEEKAEDENLRLYGRVVAGKLDEKIRELEQEILQRRETEEKLQALSLGLLERLELERRHVARELHDDIGQALTAVKLSLQSIQRSPDEDGLLRMLQQSIGSIDQAIQRVRNLSLNLRPSLLDDLGLPAALRWLLDRTAGPAGISSELLVADPIDERLPAEIETACFRIAQEALNNAVRHARPKNITIMLQRHGETIDLVVQDDGQGFDLQPSFDRSIKGQSFGLLGMHERADLAGGRLSIASEKGKGTTVTAHFPLRAR